MSAIITISSQCLSVPFGLAANQLAHLQKLGVHVFPYLGDWLIRGQLELQVLSSISAALSVFNTLVPLMNREKLMLKPVQTLEFSGAVIDSTKPELSYHKSGSKPFET